MLTPEKNERYISIKADGKFHERSHEGAEGAKLRSWIDRDTGQTMSKWELLYRSIDNVHITAIRFEDSDYGENILTTLSDGETEVVWAENTKSNFGSDWMKKLPNIDFTKVLSIKPYAFEDGAKGVAVFQVDKVADFFWDSEEKKKLNGFPEWPKAKDDMKKADWIMYFLVVQAFLTDYTKEHVLPKLEGIVLEHSPENISDETGLQYPGEEINPEDIPF